MISTTLYFVVFGSAIGGYISEVEGVSYGAFIVPGLIMLNLLTQSVSNASFGIFFPKFSRTIYEILSAPVSHFEIVLSYVGAAASKAVILSLIMGIFGYVEGAQTQVASAATGFKVAMSFLPAGLVLIGCLIITRYPLYGERLAQVKQKIAAGESAEQ